MVRVKYRTICTDGDAIQCGTRDDFLHFKKSDMIQLSKTNIVSESESTRPVAETKHIMPINETLLRLHVPLSVTIDDSDDVSLEIPIAFGLKANRLCPTSK